MEPLRNLFAIFRSRGNRKDLILPLEEQVTAWRAADKAMKWGIGKKAFDGIGEPPLLTEAESSQGFAGISLFYGFGSDDRAGADCVLSGKKAWEFALGRLKRRTWQSPHIDFDRPDAIRLRRGAPERPRGFYFAKINLGQQFVSSSVSRMRGGFHSFTGFAHEGFQLLCVTNRHLVDLMSERVIPFMALADYDVAPYGFGDFFDAPQLFSSNRILGLGIGNIDYNYPGFGIPVMIVQSEGI